MIRRNGRRLALMTLCLATATGCAHDGERVDSVWSALGPGPRTSWHLPPRGFFDDWGIELPGLETRGPPFDRPVAIALLPAVADRVQHAFKRSAHVELSVPSTVNRWEASGATVWTIPVHRGQTRVAITAERAGPDRYRVTLDCDGVKSVLTTSADATLLVAGFPTNAALLGLIHLADPAR